jgi:hypothetical protein
LGASFLGLLAAASLGCASSTPAPHVARALIAPVHLDAPGDVGRQPALPEQESLFAAKENTPAPMYPPEVVHAARIELAREALVSDNDAKAEQEADEAMQRAIAEARTEAESSRHTRARAVHGSAAVDPLPSMPDASGSE